jgi:hypothetical protein
MEQTSGFVRTEREMADHLDNGVVGLHWVSADGIILWANRADYEPLGYTPRGVGRASRGRVPRRPRRPRRHLAASRQGGDGLQLSGTLTSQERLIAERPDLYQRLV